ncbi:Nuclease-related domain-containing protein [Bacillus sp. cl95]|nr:Nuclease-related domain-containing protein [Bacillus sp. UNCCL13]SFQ84224.1 Nuclease-related domain-containing protein [Bacillus sp. cl95]
MFVFGVTNELRFLKMAERLKNRAIRPVKMAETVKKQAEIFSATATKLPKWKFMFINGLVLSNNVHIRPKFLQDKDCRILNPSINKKGVIKLIEKPLEVPIIIRKLSSLARRIPEDHPKRKDILKELNMRMAGYHGEESLYYFLNRIDEEKYMIFHDLRLRNGSDYFQLDFLLLTSSFAIILETKNYAGSLLFDPRTNQFSRKLDNQEITFRDPLTQAFSQVTQFQKWVKSKKLPPLTIESLVVISNHRTIYKVTPGNEEVYKKICHSFAIESRLDEIFQKYPKEVLSLQDMKKLTKKLLSCHEPFSPDVLERFKIDREEITTGIFCPKCDIAPMHYQRGKWYFGKCRKMSTERYLEALEDYFLIFGPTITNAEYRRFFHFPTGNISSKHIVALNLPYEGNKKGRRYYFPEKNLFANPKGILL